jgi:hypothetical protein
MCGVYWELDRATDRTIATFDATKEPINTKGTLCQSLLRVTG